jgi:hypothetical protein
MSDSRDNWQAAYDFVEALRSIIAAVEDGDCSIYDAQPRVQRLLDSSAAPAEEAFEDRSEPPPEYRIAQYGTEWNCWKWRVHGTWQAPTREKAVESCWAHKDSELGEQVARGPVVDETTVERFAAKIRHELSHELTPELARICAREIVASSPEILAAIQLVAAEVRREK